MRLFLAFEMEQAVPILRETGNWIEIIGRRELKIYYGVELDK